MRRRKTVGKILKSRVAQHVAAIPKGMNGAQALQQEHSLGDEDHARRVGLRVNGLPVDCVGARAGSVCASGKQKSHPKVANYLFLVARGGIEPPTQGFSILCSTD
jgi:hypothetical protein